MLCCMAIVEVYAFVEHGALRAALPMQSLHPRPSASAETLSHGMKVIVLDHHAKYGCNVRQKENTAASHVQYRF